MTARVVRQMVVEVEVAASLAAEKCPKVEVAQGVAMLPPPGPIHEHDEKDDYERNDAVGEGMTLLVRASSAYLLLYVDIRVPAPDLSRSGLQRLSAAVAATRRSELVEDSRLIGEDGCTCLIHIDGRDCRTKGANEIAERRHMTFQSLGWHPSVGDGCDLSFDLYSSASPIAAPSATVSVWSSHE